MNTYQPEPTLDIARASYRDISLYAPDRTPAAIDLSDNTNLWGVPPAASRAIHAATSASMTRYPALYAADVKRAIADYIGVPPEMVVTGCGSDDVLDSAIRAFGEPGDRIAYPDPSFAMIPIFARMNGLTGVAVPLSPEHDLHADAFIAADSKISYLCTPNNPTGRAFSRDAVERVVNSTQGVVIIDEAYAEFADRDCLDLASASPHVLVSRTLSKAFGLAGLRVGYAIGHPALIAEVEKSRGPYKVSSVAQMAAVSALTVDREWVMHAVAEAVENRARLIDALRQMGLEPLPSDSNFVLVPVPDATSADRRMREQGVAVRPFVQLPGIGDALRISIGPWQLMQQCLDALRLALRLALPQVVRSGASETA